MGCSQQPVQDYRPQPERGARHRPAPRATARSRGNALHACAPTIEMAFRRLPGANRKSTAHRARCRSAGPAPSQVDRRLIGPFQLLKSGAITTRCSWWNCALPASTVRARCTMRRARVTVCFRNAERMWCMRISSHWHRTALSVDVQAWCMRAVHADPLAMYRQGVLTLRARIVCRHCERNGWNRHNPDLQGVRTTLAATEMPCMLSLQGLVCEPGSFVHQRQGQLRRRQRGRGHVLRRHGHHGQGQRRGARPQPLAQAALRQRRQGRAQGIPRQGHRACPSAPVLRMCGMSA